MKRAGDGCIAAIRERADGGRDGNCSEDVASCDSQLSPPGEPSDCSQFGVGLRSGVEEADEPGSRRVCVSNVFQAPVVGQPRDELGYPIDEGSQQATGPQKATESFSRKGVALEQSDQRRVVRSVGEQGAKLA